MNETKTCDKAQDRDQIKNQWIMCPSRTFPNKYYYFNPASGVAVWNLDDVDQLPKLEQQPKRQVPPQTQPTSNFASNGNTSMEYPYFLNAYIPMIPVYQPMFTAPLPIQNQETLSNCPTKNPEVLVEKTSIPLTNRFQITKTINVEKKPTNPEKSANFYHDPVLRNDDLRYKLNKKRKADDLPQSTDKNLPDVTQEKVPKLSTNEVTATTIEKPKRNIFYPASNNVTNKIATDLTSPDVNAACLKKLAKLTMRQDIWYIVVDTNILLYQLTFIQKLVKSDPSCRLMIPYYIVCELDSMSSLSHRQARVVLARKVKRYLAKELATREYVVAQTALQASNIGSQNKSDGAIECCQQLLNQHYFVVLLSNEQRLRTASSKINLPSFSVKEITDYMAANMKFDFEKPLKIVIDNTKLPVNNQPFNDANNTDDKQIIFLEPANSYQNNNVDGSVTRFSTTMSLEDTATNRSSQQPEITNCGKPQNACKPEIANFGKPQNACKPEIANYGKPQIACKPEMANCDKPQFTYKPEIANSNFSHDKLAKNHSKSHKNVQNNKVLHLENCDIEKNSMEIDENHNFIPDNTFDLTYCALLDKYGDDDKLENTNLMVENHTDRFDKDFEVKHKIMENRLTLRMYEWLCRLTQNMEDILTEILLHKKKELNLVLPPPWNLHEAIECIKICYKRDTEANRIANNMSVTLFGCTNINGKIYENLVPSEFMKLFSCAFHLLQAIKNAEPSNGIDYDKSIELLEEMLQELQSENIDPNFICKGSNNSKNDNSVLDIGSIKDSTEQQCVRVQSYLSRHFPEVRKTENGMKDIKPTIIRTLGVNLKCIKLTKDNVLVLNKSDEGLTVTKNFASNQTANQKREILDLDVLDYSPMNEDLTVENLEEKKIDKILQRRVECKNAQLLVNSFFLEVKEVILLVKSYIDTARIEEKLGITDKDNENKVNKESIENRITNIVSIMKCILHRESFEVDNLNAILDEAGLKEVLADDKHFSQYKDVISKCLKHAEFLQEKLTNLT